MPDFGRSKSSSTGSKFLNIYTYKIWQLTLKLQKHVYWFLVWHLWKGFSMWVCVRGIQWAHHYHHPSSQAQHNGIPSSVHWCRRPRWKDREVGLAEDRCCGMRLRSNGSADESCLDKFCLGRGWRYPLRVIWGSLLSLWWKNPNRYTKM